MASFVIGATFAIADSVGFDEGKGAPNEGGGMDEDGVDGADEVA